MPVPGFSVPLSASFLAFNGPARALRIIALIVIASLVPLLPRSVGSQAHQPTTVAASAELP